MKQGCNNPTTQTHPAAAVGSCPLQREKLAPRFCEVIPSTPAALDSTVEQLMPVVKAMCCAPEETEDVELALREALANAILHGNHSDPSKKVFVACFCECEADRGLLLVVRDEGSGFDPAQVPDPTAAERIYSTHGRGIFLMRQSMDEIRYISGGNEVELRKHGTPGCRRPGQDVDHLPIPAPLARSGL